MIARSSICKPHLISQALANRLSLAASDELSDHLQCCAHCRAELERLAGDASWWNDARQFLGTLDSSDDVRLLEPGDTVRRLPLGAEYPEYSEEEAACELLQPSDNPAMLGRIGAYEVEAVVGVGGMGVVYKAQDSALQRPVAIKVLASRLATSGAARKRFAHEAQAAAAVVHDHVIPIYSIDTSSRGPFLVMPYVNGRSLQERLDAEGTLEVVEVLRIALQTARGLSAAHAQGLVHRDIKPANILLENGMQRVRITDFGLARAIDDASQTQSGFIAGTPQYMAPEQARGEPVDTRADLFSLGSVMYAMCAGHSPFRAETTLAVLRRICEDRPRDLRQINPAVPLWLMRIIERLLAKSPADRFDSATEVADVLEGWLAHVQQPTVVKKPPKLSLAPGDRRELVRKSLWSAGLAVASMATLALVFFAGGWLGQNNPRTAQQTPSTPATQNRVVSAAAPSELLPNTPARTPSGRQWLADYETNLRDAWQQTLGMESRRPAFGTNSIALEQELEQLEQRILELTSEVTSPRSATGP